MSVGAFTSMILTVFGNSCVQNGKQLKLLLQIRFGIIVNRSARLALKRIFFDLLPFAKGRFLV